MADVYVLASPQPTLYAYPSQLHPTPTPTGGGGSGVYFTTLTPATSPPLQPADDLPALLILGAL